MQGALERWHQTLKSMLHKYCFETGKDWDEGVPLVLFAIREAKQESLGFSPAELVFGHTVGGPMKVLKEQFMATALSPKAPAGFWHSESDYSTRTQWQARLSPHPRVA